MKKNYLLNVKFNVAVEKKHNPIFTKKKKVRKKKK